MAMISEGLEESLQWFAGSISKLHRRIAWLESSLLYYKIGFWSLVTLLAAFIVGAVLEAW